MLQVIQKRPADENVQYLKNISYRSLYYSDQLRIVYFYRRLSEETGKFVNTYRARKHTQALKVLSLCIRSW